MIRKSRSFVGFALVFAAALASTGAGPGSDDAFYESNAEYDRLDGAGPSHKKVDVIEWEGNLEVHVYPAGSLKGLALKIDDSTGKKVMVLGYRFDHAPSRQYVRRYTLAVPLTATFKTFRDTTADGYDKIVITNNSLAGEMVAFKADPPPTELYPEGHPKNSKTIVKGGTTETRQPAAASKGASSHTDGGGQQAPKTFDEDTGSVGYFNH